MANIDATTPQLTVVKKWIDAHSALNLDHVELLMAKDFKFQTFPKSHKTPEERREHYIEKHKGMATAVTKAHVRINSGELSLIPRANLRRT